MIEDIICYNSTNPSKVYTINNAENVFFENLFSTLNCENLNHKITLKRMNNGTIAVEYASYPIGKIKLQGKKYSMQILKSLYKFDEIEGSIEDFIEHQIDWVNYIKKYILKELKEK